MLLLIKPPPVLAPISDSSLKLLGQLPNGSLGFHHSLYILVGIVLYVENFCISPINIHIYLCVHSPLDSNVLGKM